MTINGPAVILFCFYVAAAERQGVPSTKLRGTVQNDILKEYMAQHAWCYPIEPALRLIVDLFQWGAEHAPLWNTVSISGYHIREAGATAAQELAFTLADGFTYVERGIARGLDVDAFAPRLSFFFDIHNDFFEEIAKLRAARRIWARHMRDRYGATDPRSWMLRFHSQTAGVTLTAQQPMNNIVRVAYQAMAAVLGGTQSLHTNSMDETLALPTEEAVQVALRTQQLLAYETGVPNVIDPLGGSHYIEALTDRLEREAEEIFQEIDQVGGVVPGSSRGGSNEDRRVGGTAAVGNRAAPPRGRRRQRVRHRRAGAHDPAAQGWRGHDDSAARAAVEAARDARQRSREASPDGAHCGGGDDREPDPAHPRLREGVLHALRDSRGDGVGVRRV
jgi:methylmalonyl-CoA mutase N-terminal domain/subunit